MECFETRERIGRVRQELKDRGGKTRWYKERKEKVLRTEKGKRM